MSTEETVEDPTIVCTLAAAEMGDRVAEWRATLDHVTSRNETPAGALRLEFDDRVGLEELARLVIAEQGCCEFFAFAITVDRRGVALEVAAPESARDLVTSLFGAG